MLQHAQRLTVANALYEEVVHADPAAGQPDDERLPFGERGASRVIELLALEVRGEARFRSVPPDLRLVAQALYFAVQRARLPAHTLRLLRALPAEALCDLLVEEQDCSAVDEESVVGFMTRAVTEERVQRACAEQALFARLFPDFARHLLVEQLLLLGELYAFEVRGGAQVRIETPFVYSDGDLVALFLRRPEQGGATCLTDLGLTSGQLRTRWTYPLRVDEAEEGALYEELRAVYSVQYASGHLSIELARAEELAPAVIRLAQAATALDVRFPALALQDACQQALQWIRQARPLVGLPAFPQDLRIEDALAAAIIQAGGTPRTGP